ncbi:7911_t:CDS:2 [Diversispora eburnea]|uniref:7911_t:CDS:1 n=1 Tax=Diversispora eburnea TaxID=1213867 RepID=A0A9N9FCA0_9GLOM|nr:7911_t:CDS:2 [Diversispora eburnea]
MSRYPTCGNATKQSIITASPEMATLPTLPPIRTLSCENLLPPILSLSQQPPGGSSYLNRSLSNSEQHSRYSNSNSSGGSLPSLNTQSHSAQTVISEPFVTVSPELNNRPPRRRRRPPFSYSSLIAQAILDSQDRRLTLREVYQWIMERYPQLYKADDTGWQNTIRHNLSLNKCFKKVPRSDTELGHSTSSSTASKGKGGYWTIDPEYMSAYHDGVFARGGVQKRRPGEVGLVHPGINGDMDMEIDQRDDTTITRSSPINIPSYSYSSISSERRMSYEADPSSLSFSSMKIRDLLN